jgi:hypothetical protein
MQLPNRMKSNVKDFKVFCAMPRVSRWMLMTPSSYYQKLIVVAELVEASIYPTSQVYAELFFYKQRYGYDMYLDATKSSLE